VGEERAGKLQQKCKTTKEEKASSFLFFFFKVTNNEPQFCSVVGVLKDLRNITLEGMHSTVVGIKNNKVIFYFIYLFFPT